MGDFWVTKQIYKFSGQLIDPLIFSKFKSQIIGLFSQSFKTNFPFDKLKLRKEYLYENFNAQWKFKPKRLHIHRT